MNKHSIIHRPIDNYAYVCADNSVNIMIQTQKEDCEGIKLIYGDPYDWSNKEWRNVKTLMRKTGTDQFFDYWQVVIKPPYRRLRYGFELNDGVDKIYFGEGGFSNRKPKDVAFYFAVPFVHASDAFQPPSWVKDTVWYQIFPERFANGNLENDPKETLEWGSSEPKADNFFGGDLQGVIDHISYLNDLGITGIYFTPIFKAYSNHKYDTIDYLEIDPQFGDKETLKQLVKVCHDNGIKVMLDAVFNHSGFYFPPFQDVVEKGQASKYKDWFHIREFPLSFEPMPNYDTFAFTPFMPKLNTQNQEVRNYLLNVGRYWVEEFDIDGWRLDVANEVDYAFWRDFRRVVKGIKPDLYILGEIWHDAMPWLRGDQFDAVMNYPFTRNILDLFAKETIDCKHFVESMTSVIHRYPSSINASAFNLVGSHDTPRVLNECSGDKRKVRQILTFLLTFIGTPCLYYGDEIGMDGGGDPGCRKCMIWEEDKQDHHMLEHVQKLIALRKNQPLLANEGDLSFLPVETNSNCFAFAKEKEDKKILVIFNLSKQAESFQIPALFNRQTPIDLWNGKRVHDKQVQLEAKGFSILQFSN
ncbi:alpha-glycosidase [Lederbergia sp. NSJ-179]|uniref:alpha-glycosidase n=1 Tax=Lederbergia sp. NSJ-179 TaxID=2931402 RepID=UPI001FD1CFF7|nr:alpha-glycosidase [Lederbergia sp. NSJ-179]MCJ7840275.1 alpha-glycosidase [Lederbergia sp. NSJ-179]